MKIGSSFLSKQKPHSLSWLITAGEWYPDIPSRTVSPWVSGKMNSLHNVLISGRSVRRWLVALVSCVGACGRCYAIRGTGKGKPGSVAWCGYSR